MTAYGVDAQVDRQSPEAIEHEIARTRERMVVHLDALGHKLSPDHLKQQAREAIVERAQATRSKALDFASRHPVPAAGAGLGTALLFLMKRRRRNATVARGRNGFARFMHEHPLAFALVAATVGLALGTMASDAELTRP
jgi:ElaB/YqjD/DUF883 family membrane-anchored ribosome-binding protein